MYLLQAGDPENVQILVAGTTNIAVDNILLGLVKNGFDRYVALEASSRVSGSRSADKIDAILVTAASLESEV